MTNKVKEENFMFKKYRQSLFNRKHFIIVKEEEVIPAIKAISACSKVPEANNTFVRNAGWEHKPDKWFISFTCYNRDWENLMNLLISIAPSVEILR
jgi:hypothetical protein